MIECKTLQIGFAILLIAPYRSVFFKNLSISYIKQQCVNQVKAPLLFVHTYDTFKFMKNSLPVMK
jgi:hypothetical protein